MIHLALVGCGGFAQNHAKTFKMIEEAKVVALVDPVPAQTRSFKEKYFPEAAEYPSFEKLLAEPPAKLDAVVLVTPHTMHFAQAKAAIEKGLNVLVEKPMVTSSTDAYELWKTVKKAGKLLAISFQGPYSMEYQAIKRMRDSGEIGTIQIVQGWIAQAWLKATMGKWRQEPGKAGGGQLYDSGAHVLNSLMWLVNSPVIEVGCFYDKCGTPVDINGVAIMKFQNGCLGSVAIGGNSPGAGDPSVTVQTDTMVIKTGSRGEWLEVSKEGKKIYPQVEVDERPAGGTSQRNFVDALMGKAEPQSPVRYGVLLSAMMDALYESADSGKIVKVKPVPEEI